MVIFDVWNLVNSKKIARGPENEKSLFGYAVRTKGETNFGAFKLEF